MRSLRLQFATVWAFFASNWLQHVHCALANGYCMHIVRYQSTKYLTSVYAYKEQNILRFATVCSLYASNLLPYAHCTLAIGYRIRNVQFTIICAVYANKANHMLILPI
jgi:hypothetical protein